MAMSVFHRVTGTALYGGTALVAIWLVALASGPAAYGWVTWFFGSIVGRLVLFVYTWILMHHMLGGLRHFIWDFGYGFDREQRMGLARATLIGSVILTVLIWALALVLR
jgi:succinate dehydrogenase / fumarate reductase cytochrome b subunit